MQCSAMQRNAVQCSAMQYRLQCSAVQCSAVQCSAVQCGAGQGSAHDFAVSAPPQPTRHQPPTNSHPPPFHHSSIPVNTTNRRSHSARITLAVALLLSHSVAPTFALYHSFVPTHPILPLLHLFLVPLMFPPPHLFSPDRLTDFHPNSHRLPETTTDNSLLFPQTPCHSQRLPQTQQTATYPTYSHLSPLVPTYTSSRTSIHSSRLVI
jgi:hypothetical protein